MTKAILYLPTGKYLKYPGSGYIITETSINKERIESICNDLNGFYANQNWILFNEITLPTIKEHFEIVEIG